MLSNYFKTMLRSLLKNKGYSALNILGLATGLACAAFIFLWVEDEVNYDHSFSKRGLLYQIEVSDTIDAGIRTHLSTPALMAPSIEAEIPGIAHACRKTEGNDTKLFSVGDKRVYASGNYADPSIFNMLSLSFIKGDEAHAFTQPYSIVLTQSGAKKIFGGTDAAIGKTVRMDNSQDYLVSGIIKDLPDNSTLKFEWLAPFDIVFRDNNSMHQWYNFNVHTLVELKPGVDPGIVNGKLANYISIKEGLASGTRPFLFSMNDWHLRNEFANGKMTGSGQIKFVHLFSMIAWIILLIACINFMNLATARSEKRAREVGVRKVLGADKKRLALQFIGEAILVALIAAIVAVIIMMLTLPAFNSLVQKNLTLGLDQPLHIGALLSLVLICGLVAGSYPSLYLSSFNPVYVLKGLKLKTGSAAVIRKGLVITQFTVSIVLIISTIIIYRQIQHGKSRDLGYNKDNLVQLGASAGIVKSFAAIRQDLLNTNMVENATLADHQTLKGGNNTTSIGWPGKPANATIVISQRRVSSEFLSTTGMHLSEGRDFVPTDVVEYNEHRVPRNPSQVLKIIITESLEKILGKGSAIGKPLTQDINGVTYNLEVVGVVKDYVYGDMYGNGDPVIFYDIPQAANLMYVRIKGNDPQRALAKMEAVMTKDNPAYPFDYKFVDDQFNNVFQDEMLVSKLSRVFATLAIIISCLGLFGLAAYTAERRTREIGVRKVLGASVAGITGLLSKDFLLLVAISCAVAFPIAWWIMHNWLLNYEYRIGVEWWIFLLAAALAIAIAWITVSFHAIKAAVVNPSRSLRSE